MFTGSRELFTSPLLEHKAYAVLNVKATKPNDEFNVNIQL